MKNMSTIYRFLILSFLCQVLISCASSEKLALKEIELIDPVYPEEAKRQHELNIYKGKDGYIEQYSLYLKNSVCLDEKCKLVEVTMYWDDAGNYSHLSYPENKPLTKVEHDPFTKEDYLRLDTILKDKTSILQNHSLAYLAKEPEKPKKKKEEVDTFIDPLSSFGAPLEDDEDVDGEAIATPAAVKDAVVKDAAWTTWVLWTYANTEIVPILHTETLAQATPYYIQKTLDSGDWSKIEFIINHLDSEKIYSQDYIDSISASLAKASIDQIEPALAYLKKASKSQNDYFECLINTLPKQGNYNAALIIDQLSQQQSLDDQILLSLTAKLKEVSYYAVHLSLRTIEDKDLYSEKIETNLSKLLDVKDFFTARRAYNYLSEKKLSAQTMQKMESFAQKHEDRL